MEKFKTKAIFQACNAHDNKPHLSSFFGYAVGKYFHKWQKYKTKICS